MKLVFPTDVIPVRMLRSSPGNVCAWYDASTFRTTAQRLDFM